MPNYYMFLLFLLFVVLAILSFRDSIKEGLDSQEKVGKIYDNYAIMNRSFEEYNARFKSLAM